MSNILNIGGYKEISSDLKSGTGSLLRMPISDPNHPDFATRGQVVITTTGSMGLNHRRVSASRLDVPTTTNLSTQGLELNEIFTTSGTDVPGFYIAPHVQVEGVTAFDVDGDDLLFSVSFTY